MRLALALVASAIVAGFGRGDDVLPPATLKAVKAATVFVKVATPTANATGSGFVIRSDGDTVFAVTNHHVVAPDAEKDKSKPARSAPLGKVTLVFGSGTAAERTVPADIIATDTGRNLAVLRAKGVVDPPAGISLSAKPQVVETMTVYTFGFPFGQKLALGQPTPAVTVGKASVSSLRLERGELKFVQLEGELNPGNSGGPVVDGNGRLVGVAVGKVQDTRIAVAIARPQLDAVLRPRISRATISLRDAQAGTEVGFDIRLYDPAGAIRSASLGVARRSALRTAGPTDDLTTLPGGKLLSLQLKGSSAVGKFASQSPVGEEDFPFAWQVVLTDAEGKVTRGDPAKPPPTTFRRAGVSP